MSAKAISGDDPRIKNMGYRDQEEWLKTYDLGQKTKINETKIGEKFNLIYKLENMSEDIERYFSEGAI